jgi:predicted nucleotidyltransferase component of viral defense system
LVQVDAAPFGPTLDAIRKRLDPWLGEPMRERGSGSVTLKYRFQSELPPVTNLRLKVEVNTREHFSILGLETHKFSVASRWFSGRADIPTYRLEEMLGTKLRALYQRKKGRDLFDIVASLEEFPKMNRENVVNCFLKYMEHGRHRVSRAEYEANLAQKLLVRSFTDDLPPLLAIDAANDFNFQEAAELLRSEFLSLLPGEPWASPKATRGKKK